MTTFLTVSLEGNPLIRHPVTYAGGQQMVEVPMKAPDLKGKLRLSFELEPLENEVSLVNNSDERFVTLIEEKVKVLYVEGAPRWEYRYLRTVLIAIRVSALSFS